MEVTIATMSKASRCKDEETYTIGFVPSYLLPDGRSNSLDPFLDPLISDLEAGFIEGRTNDYIESINTKTTGSIIVNFVIIYIIYLYILYDHKKTCFCLLSDPQTSNCWCHIV